MTHLPFLDRVASHLLERHHERLHDVCLIFPSRRSGTFFKKYLARYLQKPVIMPGIFSIEDFVFEITGLRNADPLWLIWQLYEEYCHVHVAEARPFEEFIKWGQILLNDFEEVDMHLVDARALFANLSETKAIDSWNLGAQLSERQKQYLAFYQSLSDIYERFTNNLLSTYQAYNGLAFRYCASNISSLIHIRHWKKYVFAGFNALSPTENMIITGMRSVSQVEMLFDADSWYLDNPAYEAGHNLRSLKHRLSINPLPWTGDYLRGSAKEIHHTGISGNIGQTRLAGRLLAGMTDEQLEQTALILCDEGLLIPMLQAIPGNVKLFNITMGYPLSLTPAYTLIEHLLILHLHASERNKTLNRPTDEISGIHFYFRELLQVIRHPYVIRAAKHYAPSFEGIDQKIMASGRVFLSLEQLEQMTGHPAAIEILRLLLSGWTTPADVCRQTDRLLSMLRKALSESQSTTDIEYIYQFWLINNRLQALVKKAGNQLNLRSVQLILSNLAGSVRLPFTGEPLAGLQIMGMLETRTLDFANIIMLSVNEGILPKSRHEISFITHEFRKAFGIATYFDKESVSAYHFYRLLHRADTIHFLYNNLAGELGGGERSRYLMQIEHELVPENKTMRFHASVANPGIELNQSPEVICITKNDRILEQLVRMAASGFSPSALSTWVQCPLKFYFSYLLRVEEETETNDEMDAATFGTALHHALKTLHEPYKGKPLTTEMFTDMESRYRDVLKEAFVSTYEGGDLEFGKNHLMFKVAQGFIRRFIALEKQQINELSLKNQHLIIHELEYFFPNIPALQIPVNQTGKPPVGVRIKGQADRIDSLNNEIRIIDYKTGDVAQGALSITEWERLISDPKKDKALQLLVYSWLYAREKNAPMPNAGIISFRKLNRGLQTLKVNAPAEDPLSKTQEVITTILSQIYDPAVSFNQTTDTDLCRYCSYACLCNRRTRNSD